MSTPISSDSFQLRSSSHQSSSLYFNYAPSNVKNNKLPQIVNSRNYNNHEQKFSVIYRRHLVDLITQDGRNTFSIHRCSCMVQANLSETELYNMLLEDYVLYISLAYNTKISSANRLISVAGIPAQGAKDS